MAGTRALVLLVLLIPLAGAFFDKGGGEGYGGGGGYGGGKGKGGGGKGSGSSCTVKGSYCQVQHCQNLLTFPVSLL